MAWCAISSFGKIKKIKFASNGAPCVWCAISNEDTNGAPVSGAPLLYSSGAPHTWCAINVHISYSPFPSSDSMMAVQWLSRIVIETGILHIMDNLPEGSKKVVMPLRFSVSFFKNFIPSSFFCTTFVDQPGSLFIP